jgi:UDP-glucose 4-epimerase
VRRVTGAKLTFTEQPRRAGDVPRVFADPTRIRRELGWEAKITDLDEIVATAWSWFSKHPNGYRA